jgi:bacteriophage N4 adsorption protein B
MLIRKAPSIRGVTLCDNFANVFKRAKLRANMYQIWTWVDLASAIAFACQALVPPLAVAMALSGIDDLFVDTLFALRLLQRRQWRKQHLTVADVTNTQTPGHIAVLIPAWDESDVITDMLMTTLERWQDDTQVRLFVGWYINDKATGRAIAQLAATDPRIIPVIVPHNGPTTKADCLNHMWGAANQYATDQQKIWLAFLLHDAEDLVCRNELDMLRHMIVRRGKALVQFPVIPVPVPGSPFISGHYLDEFAESHAKDMVVREWMGAPIPAAGVGCAFAAQALQNVATARGGLPFNNDSLTEDYELGLMVSSNAPSAFVRIATNPHDKLVGTRGHFPEHFWRAVRQKSRWLTGITLSGWDRIGWTGNFFHRYWLARDRKALFTFYINASAYFIVTFYVLLWIWQRLDKNALHFPRSEYPAWINTALLFNLVLLGWRLVVRATFVWRLSGWQQALLSVPRALVSNIINICAACHAIWHFVRASCQRQSLTWNKTSHRFPVRRGVGP